MKKRPFFLNLSFIKSGLQLLLLFFAIAVFSLLMFTGAIATASPASFAEVLPDPAVETVLPEASPTRHSLDTSTIPSEKISQFVEAYLQVLNLIERRQDELAAAKDSQKSQQISREIEGEALDIIENAGLTKQEYLQLLSLANIDPEFGERIAARLQETKNERSSIVD